MLKSIEFRGKTADDAIANALAELGLERDDISVEIVERGKSGFLGIGSVEAVIRVSYEGPDEEEPAPVIPEEPKMEETGELEQAETPEQTEESDKLGDPEETDEADHNADSGELGNSELMDETEPSGNLEETEGSEQTDESDVLGDSELTDEQEELEDSELEEETDMLEDAEDSSETETVYEIVVRQTISLGGSADSGELFEQYINSVLPSRSRGIKLMAASTTGYAGEQLGTDTKTYMLYEKLINVVKEVATGKYNSTIFEIASV